MANQDKTELPFFNIEKLHEYITKIAQALDVSCTKGQFGLNDAFLLKAGINNVAAAVNTLGKHQEIQLQLQKEQETRIRQQKTSKVKNTK